MNQKQKESTAKEGKNKRLKKIIMIETIILCIVVGIYIFISLSNNNWGNDNTNNTQAGPITGDLNNNNQQNADNSIEPTLSPKEIEQQRLEEEEKEKERLEKERLENERRAEEEIVTALVEKADLLAMGYDYNGAIKMIKSFEGDYTKNENLQAAIAGYKATKETLVPLGAYDSVNQISHIFFHSLVADTAKAFDGDREANGYNYYMTTISEFNQMMEQMYKEGYVLVSIYDVAKEEDLKAGKTNFIAGDILLPPDKKPFVISQDDVNFYKYMNEDGFASRMVIDDNGRPSTEMILEDGTVTVGDYDLVPVLETFIAEHPDFSYKGARGIIALTGYEGTLGYRTNDEQSPTYEQDKKTVKQVAEVMKEWGWEFASHSYGHRNMLTYDYKFLKNDTDRWLEEVGSLVGPTDIYIYPYGIDIETTTGHYSSDKFNYLKSVGFNYYCGVFKSPWIQVKDDYVRMTRRPLDGQAMLQFPERLKDLFDLSTVIDSSRPALK